HSCSSIIQRDSHLDSPLFNGCPHGIGCRYRIRDTPNPHASETGSNRLYACGCGDNACAEYYANMRRPEEPVESIFVLRYDSYCFTTFCMSPIANYLYFWE